MTLTRLPDPTPDFWEKDFTKVLSTINTCAGFRKEYGNFWAKRPCLFRSHQWLVLKLTDTQDYQGRYSRQIRRCQRCGSQVHQGSTVKPPTRGTI